MSVTLKKAGAYKDGNVQGNKFLLLSSDNSDTVDLVDVVYPVGSIYMSVNNVSPATLFGGTWVQIEDTFLLGAGTSYTAGDTGGEATHVLTVDEMPEHKHTLEVHIGYGAGGSGGYGSAWGRADQNNPANKWPASCQMAGGNLGHNNMPPYLVVYMWKRTA